MKITFNPSTVAALTTPPNNKDITFDLRGHSIFARGVEFKGTDTNTWRDIKINNVSIGSHTLDLRNGSNTTLTNTNGVVTINSTWRPVVDNLTSDSTTSSLSAKQGKVLKALIDGKSNSDHNHDGRYVRAFGTSNDNIDSDWGQSFKTFDPIPLGTPPEKNPNISLLSIGENFNRRKQLAFIQNNDNIYYRRHIDSGFTNWRRLAFANEIPTSLKNPYALTISLNGTSQGPYDGSAAKNINITPGSIGAAVSNHSHDYLVVNSADDKSFNSAYHNFQVLYAGGGNKITGKPANVDAFGLFKFRAASEWSGQMLLANGGSLYIRSSEDAKMTNTLAWKTILDSSNYSGILDSRYYTESEVNSLLDAKLNRQNLSYGNWNPRGYHLAADYHYNGGDLSISENNGKMYISVDGYFWQNEGQYRVLDTSDIGDIRDSVTIHQYLSATDAAWYPLVWGGASHNNTSASTGPIYKSYDKLCWQTSSQTLYATNIQTNNIKNLSIGGGIYWNPNVESATNDSDAASITLVRSGVAGGTTLVLSQMNDTDDTIQFKTNTAARLYHNSYPILTTQNTYVSNNKGYINGLEITQVNNADTLDGAHLSDIKNWSDRTASAYWKAGWYKIASAQTAINVEAFLTLDVNSSNSKGHATLFIKKRADREPYFICIHNNNLDLADFRLYYNGMSMVLYARVPYDWCGRVFRIISEGREGTYNHIWTLYSNASSTDPNAISAEGGNPYINPTYSGRVDWSNSSDKANYANSAGSVAWNNVTGKPSAFNPAAHTHTVFKNNLMIKGTNGISDIAAIHLGIGDSDTGFKWISDGVCQIYADNVAVGQWTSWGMDWFKNPTVNGNKVWNAGNDGSGSGLDADTLDGAHLSDIKNWSDRTASAYWKAGWYKIASAQTAINVEAFLTLDVNSSNSKGHATLFIKKRADREPYFICIHNNNLDLADFRLYYNGMSMVLYARVPYDWCGRVFRIISEGREGTYNHIWTLYSNASSTDPNAISAEGGNPYINPTYSGRVDWSNSSDKANYANSAGSVAWNNVTGKPSAFNPAAHTHTVFKNNLMIKGTNGISDIAAIHLGIGDSDTGFKWISDGVCQIYADNVAVGQWTSWGMDWFKNPTVNGNKVWNAGNDGSGSGLDADTLDGYHANGSNDRPYGHIPTIESNGVMEVGRYIDFHNDNNGKHDFSTRLQSTGNYGNEVNLPSASGTLALINDVNNYYWANVKISTSSSTTTSPTFSNVYLGNSLYLNTRGSNSIYNGPNDSANGVGGPLNNLVFSSWYGVSFTTSCAGLTYTNKNAVSINCRTGQLYAREVQANGFMHTGHNNNDAVLLAGGGYKTLKDFICSNKSANYTDREHYNLAFHKFSNNLVWVDGHVKGFIAKSFVIDPAFFPYRYDEDPDLNTIYLMSGKNYITINAIGVVTINNATDHKQRVGFFYVGRT